MNKRIKSIIATATVLVLGAFSLNYLHAEEVKAYDQCSGTHKIYTSKMNKKVKINESKLTNLSYFKKTYKAKYKYVRNNAVGYFSSDEKAGFVKVVNAHGTKKGTVVKMGVVNVDDEVYGRVVFREPGLLTLACNLHDTEYSFKGRLAAYFTEEEVEDMVKKMKDLAIGLALDLKGEN